MFNKVTLCGLFFFIIVSTLWDFGLPQFNLHIYRTAIWRIRAERKKAAGNEARLIIDKLEPRVMLAQIRTYILYVYYIDPEPKHAVELIILLLLFCLDALFYLFLFFYSVILCGIGVGYNTNGWFVIIKILIEFNTDYYLVFQYTKTNDGKSRCYLFFG